MRTIKLIIVFWFVFSLAAKSQIEQAKLIGAYTYNIAQYTTWLNEFEYENFGIVLISENQMVVDEFVMFSKTKQIKGKPVRLQVYKYPPSILPLWAQIILVTEDKLDFYNDIYRLTNERCILLISQNIEEKRNVMINLFSTDDQVLVFEVNKANIINHGLVIDPEILLLGGSEIDVAELYRSSQKTLENLSDKLLIMNDSFVVLNKWVNQSLALVNEQNTKLLEQDSLLAKQDIEIHKGQKTIAQHTNEIYVQQLKIDEQISKLNEQKELLQNKKAYLDKQTKYIEDQQVEISKSKVELDSLSAEIFKKNTVLDQQRDIIRRQKITVLLTGTTIILFLIVLFVIILGYRNNLKKNKLLLAQKLEKDRINQTLKESNAQLYKTIVMLKETQSQLVTSEKMASLGVLTAGVAHEINNPVNFIYTGINSLKRDMEELFEIINEIENTFKDESSAELLNKIDDLKQNMALADIIEIINQTIDDIKIGAERTTEIVKGLRNFSRMDKDSTQMYDVHNGIDSALLLLRNKYKNHIEIEKDYQHVPAIQCNSGKLNQVFLNILSNAIDAIAEKGKIKIETSHNEHMVYINISDTGKGIPNEILDKIFDPFFTTKNVGEGVGLGLSISFGIIEEHKGKIEVKTDPNSGTTFTISLPDNIS